MDVDIGWEERRSGGRDIDHPLRYLKTRLPNIPNIPNIQALQIVLIGNRDYRTLEGVRTMPAEIRTFLTYLRGERSVNSTGKRRS